MVIMIGLITYFSKELEIAHATSGFSHGTFELQVHFQPPCHNFNDHPIDNMNIFVLNTFVWTVLNNYEKIQKFKYEKDKGSTSPPIKIYVKGFEFIYIPLFEAHSFPLNG